MASLVGQPTMQMQMGFPGTSPGYHTMGHHANHFYGYGPSFAMAQYPAAPAPAPAANGGSETPDSHSNNEDGSEGRGGGGQQQRKLSGMTPLVFAPTNNAMMARRASIGGHDGNFHPAVMQVVSADSQMDTGPMTGATHQAVMVPVGSVVSLQQPKKWVRWSEHEDQVLRSAVHQWGENNFRHISEQVFHGSRTEVQCKTRWKKVSCFQCLDFIREIDAHGIFATHTQFDSKALQPGLVKGHWTKEEDSIITESVADGNMKWSDIAKHLPGRIGDSVKERWVNVLDPEVKKGIWTQEEMRVLKQASVQCVLLSLLLHCSNRQI